MVTPANDSAPRTTLLLMWVSFLIAPLVYAAVAFTLRPAGVAAAVPASPPLSDPLTLGLGVAGLFAAVAGLVLPRFVAARLRATVADPRALSDDDRARLLRVPLTVRWAMFDAIAVCGFVLVFVGRPATLVVPFCAVALALLVLHPPTSGQLEGLLGD